MHCEMIIPDLRVMKNINHSHVQLKDNTVTKDENVSKSEYRLG